jgi:DNA (cytosine-5)-methyltransferase 1
LTYREAARLQSFPDSFVFSGNKGDWAKQIGNAVPPLLGFHIARSLPKIGQTVDLFSGAGGLGLGFQWAGWQSSVANELVPSYAKTYEAMFHERVITGDISDAGIRRNITGLARAYREPSVPLAVLGGPPCQGFSTAGKRRSMDDPRNHLFKDYLAILDDLEPEFFVFENVTGLLSMEGGAVYELITSELRKRCDVLEEWVLSADQYGVPQRRQRVVLVGHNSSNRVDRPAPTHAGVGAKSAPGSDYVTAADALGDLPSLRAGEDGTQLDYARPATDFQRLMRGDIPATAYLASSLEESVIA